MEQPKALTNLSPTMQRIVVVLFYGAVIAVSASIVQLPFILWKLW